MGQFMSVASGKHETIGMTVLKAQLDVIKYQLPLSVAIYGFALAKREVCQQLGTRLIMMPTLVQSLVNVFNQRLIDAVINTTLML